MNNNVNNVNTAWVKTLTDIHKEGIEVSPQQKKTKELLAYTSVVNMECPIISILDRKMNYDFMFGEAAFILSGSNRAANITSIMKAIGKFSDDGVTFNGAYGPKVMEQVSYVVNTLDADTDSRQAVMTIWRERPAYSKDIPCTISLQFMIRDNKLNCHANMRSSDSWLGWVYDTFNFSMISHYVCNWYNILNADKNQIEPGHLFLTAASQHIYEEQLELTRQIALDITTQKKSYSVFNSIYHNYEHPDMLLSDLDACARREFDKVIDTNKAVIADILKPEDAQDETS